MQKTVKLSNRIEIPVLGYGTWRNTDPSECVEGVKNALLMGYRHIDTAQMYGNEELVGEGMRLSGVPREEIFLTSKLNNSNHGYENTVRTIDESLEKLGTDYLDLFLIHWPVVDGHEEDWREDNIETWRALEEAYEAGKLKAIGLSNFKVEHLENLLPNCRIKPMVNQLRLHPGLLQAETVAMSREAGMAIQAWSPLSPIPQMAENETIIQMAEKYQKSIAQLLLRYGIDKNYIPLTKSVHEERIKENFEVFDFELDQADLDFFDQWEWQGDIFL
ncbi:aldo/keto reductase [Jeotgalibaca ciconiae]|uniref:Aldo/keto reductase n=1 Tax=Jeotgalibaca ciconiae TaxID=2496265 RepID=A0A3S9HAH5_9LACT|nr:aldo/keto reductase [Jeotgalibaca ciconiae]AZP04331.1 aldo/keto reductase [Jeotgalibaca ciconiae]